MKKDTESKIHEAFQKMDDSFTAAPPNKATLTVMLRKREREFKRKQKQELFLFMVAAAISIIALLLVLTKAPVVYMIIQLAGFILVPLYVTYEGKKRAGKDRAI
ncbi:MAG: YxlC family protein [Bacillus sp. (in: firmicutes)]